MEALKAEPSSADIILKIYDDVAAEWAETSPYGPPPLNSGVCPDGTPLEISVRISESGLDQIRFIAQPGEPGLAEGESLDFEVRRALDFVGRWAGSTGQEQLSEALSIFPTNDVDSFTGNFRLWLGAAADKSGAHVAKVYLNPWACSLDHQGALALYHWLKVAGYTTEGLRRMQPWLTSDIQFTPHILGWNLSDEGVTAVKLYLQGSLNSRMLSRLTDDPETGADACWTPWNQSGVPIRPEGEVHVALVCLPEGDPVTRFNLFCPDWFRSDLDVLAAFAAIHPEWPEEIWETLAFVCKRSRRNGRIFNFASLDPDSVTLYLKVG